MRVAVVNISEGRFSGGYLKYLRMVLPLLTRDPRVEALDVYVPHWAADLEIGVPLIAWPEDDASTGHTWLKQRLDETRPDVVFIPASRSFDCGDIPLVIMLRNMEALAVPFGGNRPIEAIKNLGRAVLARRAHKNATRTIAVSDFVRDFIVARWKSDPGSVGVVYHGIESPPEADQRRRPEILGDVESGSFFFTAGSLRPARGLEDAIEALALLNRSEPRRKLVVCGEPNPGTEFYGPRMKRLAEKRGVGDDVIFTGHVDPAEVAWCFANCELFIVTSRVEACPNTVLEAMTHGCNTVSSDDRPMPDFLEDAAVYYRSGDSRDLAAKVEQVLSEPEETRRSRQDRAVTRAKQFDWHVTAEKTVTELARAARRAG